MSLEPTSTRKIIHIDMDAFYASVEQRDNPELVGKPIAVGGGDKRGVTTTASYEARKFGVRSAMPGWKARELCPSIIFVKPRFEAYKEVSRHIREIFHRYTDIIEPLSLDEAFLDVTINKIDEPIATVIAQFIQRDIFNETRLTASAGVSYCKFLAKIASDIHKPNGITVIKPNQAIEFLEKLAVKDFFGVGKVTSVKMERLGIRTGKDLKAWTKVDLAGAFGKQGSLYYDLVRGIDERPVQSDRIRKSYAVERTLDEYLNDANDVHEFIDSLAVTLHQGITKSAFRAKTLTLKLKNKDFVIKTRSHTSRSIITEISEIRELAHKLVNENLDLCSDIRLIGLTLSNVEGEENTGGQLALDLKV